MADQQLPPVAAPPQRIPSQILRIAGPWHGKITKQPLDAQQQGSVLASLDFISTDCRTGRARLSVRPGYSSYGSLSNAVGYYTLGSAASDPGGVLLMAATSSTLYKIVSGTFTSVGSITSTSGRSIQAASVGIKLFVACDAPYKYYTYGGTTASWTATTAGTIPANCRLITAWNGRIVLAADPANPDVVNFARTDDPFDWDFTQEDNGTAIAVPVGEAVTCLIPHNHDCLLIGSKSGMSIFRGSPSASGSFEKFAFTVGPVNSAAWCKTADDYTYFVGHDGLYKMAPGCGNPAEDASRNLIPNGLLGIDGTNTAAYLVYDERFRGIQIHCQGTNAQSWFYDIDGGGFWPITAPGTGILAAYRFGLLDSPTASGALVATSSGTMRLDNATALGGSSMAYATLLMGLAPLGHKMLVQNATVLFGENTDDTGATVELYGGQSAVAAAALTADRKDSITIGKLQTNHNNWAMPRVGGQSLALKITQSDTSKYISLEGASLTVRPSGRERG